MATFSTSVWTSFLHIAFSVHGTPLLSLSLQSFLCPPHEKKMRTEIHVCCATSACGMWMLPTLFCNIHCILWDLACVCAQCMAQHAVLCERSSCTSLAAVLCGHDPAPEPFSLFPPAHPLSLSLLLFLTSSIYGASGLALQTTVVSSTGGTPFTGTPLPSERQGDAGYLKLAIMANGASSCLQSGPPW